MSVPKIFNINQKSDFDQHTKTIFKKKYRRYYIRRRMAAEINCVYDAKFEGNILIVGRTGCGKTIFVQNLGKNRMFGEQKEVTWISITSLSRDRENNIRNCLNENINFEYPNSIEEFDDLLEHFQRQKSTCIENCLGENIKLGRLIVMDDVLGLADCSETFANFLIVSRKFGISCV